VPAAFEIPDIARLTAAPPQHKPRILMLYGSLRERSYSRFLTLEGQRLLQASNGDVRIFHANGLPLPNDAPDTHPKVQELR
jgi:arsenic resistance protein ArsH